VIEAFTPARPQRYTFKIMQILNRPK
jgi:hypothetical protein